MEKLKIFLKRKDIEISRQRYLIDAMSAMTLGLFSSLIIGLILKTLGQQILLIWDENVVGVFLVDLGALATQLSGSAIGAAVAWGVKSPPMVIFASVITGGAGNLLGGPAGALISGLIGAEFGKAVSKETKVDIIATPATTLIMGMLTSMTVGPIVSKLMQGLGNVIMWSTERQPLLMGIVVAVIMGLALSGPISSAALAVMTGLAGLAGGAATAGCSAHMIGFAVISFSVNGVGGLLSQGLGTSKLQMPNVVKNHWIILPATLTSMITGPLATMVFKMENIPEGSGMGTSGLVGQITTVTTMGNSSRVLLSILILHFILPACLALLFDWILRKAGKIKKSDYYLPNI